jgi:hypothetical protein
LAVVALIFGNVPGALLDISPEQIKIDWFVDVARRDRGECVVMGREWGC